MPGSKLYDWIAPIYDLSLRVGAFIDGVKPSRWRKAFIHSLGMRPEGRILGVGVGTGINLPIVARHIGVHGLIVGLDYSIPMLEHSKQRVARRNVPARLTGGNAEQLPFKSDSFDTVYTFGCFNILSNKESAVREMMRVTIPGGLIAISDKSLAAHEEGSLRKKLLKTLEPGLTAPPPLHSIPLPEDKIEQDWLWNDLFYVLKFRNPESIPKEANARGGERLTSAARAPVAKK